MEATGGAAGLKVRILARYFLRLKTPEPGSSKSQAQWTKPNIQYAIYTSIDYESHEYDQSALEATRERQQHRRPQQQHRTPPTPPHPCWVPRPTRTARHRALANTLWFTMQPQNIYAASMSFLLSILFRHLNDTGDT